MKIGIMQPYFFPYIGYFQLVNAVDYYIHFDTPQYERRGWMNRNRILSLNGEFTYISVPVIKAPQNTAICDMMIDNSQNWKERLISQLTVYKKKAPYYNEVIEFLEKTLADKFKTISELNIHTVNSVCDFIGVSTRKDVFSEMNLNYDIPNAPDEWALNIAKALGYKTYVNAIGGMEFFDRGKYEKSGIDLYFLRSHTQPYIQYARHFTEGLSIIDVMMFNSKEQIKNMLDEYTLV